MSEQQRDHAPSVADVASEPAEESLEHERDAVGDEPDTGDLVPQDDAQ